MTGKAESRRTAGPPGVGDALMQLTRWIELTQAFAARKLGIHSTDLACIGYLVATEEPVTPKQIIQHLGVTASAGTALLDRLEAAGYIARIRNPKDRRGLIIVLDHEAAAAPIEFYRTLHDRVGAAIARRSDAHRRVIADFLAEISVTTDGLLDLDSADPPGDGRERTGPAAPPAHAPSEPR